MPGALRCGIYYVPEAYGQRTRDIVGRQSAGREFLKAYASARRERGYDCVADSPADFELFRAQIGQIGGDADRAWHIGANDPYSIARLGTLYWPDPAIGPLAWARRSLRDDAYSLCGVTHTLSESGVIRAIQDLFVAPVHEWDALICTSAAGRRAVESILAEWSAYLGQRMGTPGRVLVQLPVIPLGVDTERFRRTPARRAAGAKLRRRLGIPESAVVGLYFGRLNFLTKSHPTPMFMAVERAAAQAEAEGVDLRLLMVGQFSNPVVENEFRGLARKYGRRVAIHWVNGSDDAEAEASWHASDFFLSFPDNMQETFGMTVVEAMAASLPCVVSDWSGLKESVVDGETGFLVPTWAPSTHAGPMFMTRAGWQIERFDDAVAALSQVVAVDIALCAERIVALATNPDLRGRLSRQARLRAERLYGWSAILARYEDLWLELSAIRTRHARNPAAGSRPVLRPGQTDPFVAFGHFATGTVTSALRVRCLDADARSRLATIQADPAHALLLPMLLPSSDILAIIDFVQERGSAGIGEIQEAYARLRPEKVELTLLWLSKFGVVAIE